jgi:hypothetical protein
MVLERHEKKKKKKNRVKIKGDGQEVNSFNGFNFKVQGSNEESETDDEDMKLFIKSYNKYMKQHGLKHFDKLKFVRT